MPFFKVRPTGTGVFLHASAFFVPFFRFLAPKDRGLNGFLYITFGFSITKFKGGTRDVQTIKGG